MLDSPATLPRHLSGLFQQLCRRFERLRAQTAESHGGVGTTPAVSRLDVVDFPPRLSRVVGKKSDLTNGVFLELWRIFLLVVSTLKNVGQDDYSQYMGKEKMFQTTYQV